MKHLISAIVLLSLTTTFAAGQEKSRYQQRWFYAQYNLQVDSNADDVLKLIERAKKVGYNGMVLADYKFNVLDRVTPRYFKNFERVRKAANDAGIEIIPTVCPIGYSAGILAYDPNLAEGIPVKDAPFVVKDGVAILNEAKTAKLRNGDLEETVMDDHFVGFAFQDNPGKSTFADAKVKHGGKFSCRMRDFKHHASGNCRLSQRVKVRPFACYRLSAWVKTADLKPISQFQLIAIGKDGQRLSYYDDPIKSTQDWAKVDVVFNSLDASEIQIMAGMWGGKSGTLWLDNLQLEELALVNVLRRDGCPFVVTSEDGKTIYEEGKDFFPVKDAGLGKDPSAGDYKFNHAGAAVKLTDKSRIKDGARLRLSWYHPVLTHSYQVMCCMTEPKIYDVMREQIKRVNDLVKPKTFFMSHDEIRVANWCKACQDKKQTPGELLADNVRQCVKIIDDINPKAQVIVWSDMFDPHHNAVDKFYLVNGSLKESWNGLPARVMIANWNGGKMAESARWFDKRGHSQIIAGYYDGDNVDNFRQWHAATKDVPGIRGFMYTTYQHRYDQLEAYGKVLMGKE